MTEMEALGTYFFHKEMAEAHAACMKAAIETARDLLDLAGANPVGFDSSKTIGLIQMADRCKGNMLKAMGKANDAGRICGRPAIDVKF